MPRQASPEVNARGVGRLAGPLCDARADTARFRGDTGEPQPATVTLHARAACIMCCDSCEVSVVRLAESLKSFMMDIHPTLKR